MTRMYVPRWSVYVVVAALIASLSFSAGSLFTASGDSHDTTYYACLYAGSLSQVGTVPPASCGRGSPISWNAEGTQGPPGPSQAYSASQITGVPVNASETTLHTLDVPAGSYLVSAVVFLSNNGLDQRVRCDLSVDGSAMTAPDLDVAPVEVMPLQIAVTIDQPGTIALGCISQVLAIALESHLTALQVDQLN